MLGDAMSNDAMHGLVRLGMAREKQKAASMSAKHQAAFLTATQGE